MSMTRKEMEQCRSLRYEIASIETAMRSPRSTIVAVFYKDYRTGKGVPKSRQEVDHGEEELRILKGSLNICKRKLAKSGRTNDLAASVNPCNVQVKLARATGLVSGSMSVWTENGDGTMQKELTGLKHQGVLLLSRDDSASMDPSVMSAGFFTLKTTLRSGTRSRVWTMSMPFNVMAIDQGEPDWYAEDWGERPE